MGTTNVKALPAKPKGSNGDRKLFAAAVLAGIYASTGYSILSAKNHEYKVALRDARRVAYDQADEMLRSQA